MSVGDQVKEKYPKSKLIYIGIDRELFKPLNLKRIKNSVGFVNSHNDWYNYEKIKNNDKYWNLRLAQDFSKKCKPNENLKNVKPNENLKNVKPNENLKPPRMYPLHPNK